MVCAATGDQEAGRRATRWGQPTQGTGDCRGTQDLAAGVRPAIHDDDDLVQPCCLVRVSPDDPDQPDFSHDLP